MKIEIKEKWVTALESGTYNQTKNVLKNDHGYCCLGVLCDIHSKETGKEWEYIDTYGNKVYEYFGSDTTLPSEVIEWAGLTNATDGDVKVKLYASREYLANLNDAQGLDFKQIAHLIKEQL